MNLGRYRLHAQRSAGRDAVSYRASDTGDDSPAEVRVLRPSADDPVRRRVLAKRVRLAASIEHPAALRVLEASLDGEPAYVAIEWCAAPTLMATAAPRVPWPLHNVLTPARDVAACLAEAHRLGLVHGSLCATEIRASIDGALRIDLTGIDVGAGDAPARSEIDQACRAPAEIGLCATDPASDTYALGAILFWLLSGRIPAATTQPAAGALRSLCPELTEPQDRLIASMLAGDPAARPSARQVAAQLTTLLGTPTIRTTTVSDRGDRPSRAGASGARTSEILGAADSPEARPVAPPVLSRARLGRFRILEKIGEGGMGAVYRAEDTADGSIVAVKVLSSQHAARPDALRRFLKEARLLAEVNNPYVTNLLEVNEDDGIHYLAMEFVAGQSLSRLLDERGRLDEREALEIMASVARALADAHRRGLIHRDIKPDNILLVDSETTPHRVKLSDFGLARHVTQAESLELTQAGTILGTPLYMSPEQCAGTGTIDARSDVYAMGATLFHMLAGRPPFEADSPLGLVNMHLHDPPPPLKKLCPAASDAVCQITDKALAKPPALRYADAAALLDDLERILRGEPTGIAVHPRLPVCDSSRVQRFEFHWDLESPTEQLWPHVSNTERLNRAVGLSAVRFASEEDGAGGRRLFGNVRAAGMAIRWQEHPFEWVEGRRMGVLREYSSGPFRWFVSVVELGARVGGGTRLTHRLLLEPRGLLGRTVATVEVGIKARRALDRVYRRIDAALAGRLGTLADPFEEAAELPAARRERIDELLDRIVRRGGDAAAVERIGDFVTAAPDPEVARIRPLALARRLALDPDAVVSACLHAAHEGLLVLLWDVLCPVCRIPSQIQDSLRALGQHAHCAACDVDFELDFGNSIEMIFRAHPEIRSSELGTYCVGGPAHSPHVLAQTRVAPGERFELELALTEGNYRLRGPQLPYAIDFRTDPRAAAERCEIELAHGPTPETPRVLRSGAQVIRLSNQSDRELVVRIERTAPRDDALTAARAASLALFRELFPGEVLAPGQLISLSRMTFLVTELEQSASLYDELGDAAAFELIHEHFRLLDARVRGEGGAIVKTVGDGIFAAFPDAAAAVRAACGALGDLAQHERTGRLRVKAGVHRGAAMVTTLNDHLDYFGSTVHRAFELARRAGAGELFLTDAVAADPQVAAQLRLRGIEPEVTALDLRGDPKPIVHRIAPLSAPGR